MQEEEFKDILYRKGKSSEKLKDISKKRGEHIVISFDDNVVNEKDVEESVRLQKQIDDLLTEINQLKSEQKKLEKQMEGNRKSIKKSLQGVKQGDFDSVELQSDIGTAQIIPRNNDAGKVDLKEFAKVLRKRKIKKSEVIKRVEVVDEDALIEIMKDGRLSYDDFIGVAKQDISDVLTISPVAQTETTPEEKKEIVVALKVPTDNSEKDAN